MNLNKYIQVEQGFQNSVNIAYDLNNDVKIKGYIPTNASLEIIEDVLLSTFDTSNDRARILIGAYGKGKSHIILVLLTLLFRKDKELFVRLLPKIKEYSSELYNYIEGYINSPKKLLPVIIQGSNTSLTQSFLGAMQKALEQEGLKDLMPETHFHAAVNRINRWKDEFQETYKKFVELLDQPAEEFTSELNKYNIYAYEKFERLYPTLTSGSEFNPFLGFDVVELYSKIVDSLCARGFSGIYVIYDEFSKYLESSINKASIVDIKMLQDFAEKCNRSNGKQMHLMLISHKDIANYIDKLPKQKVDGWKGVSERFKHVEMQNNFSQIYEIISAVIKKDKNFFTDYYLQNGLRFKDLKNTFSSNLLFAELEPKRIDNIVYECYPLHPMTTFILPRLSEIVAQNERTLFTFLSSENRGTLSAFIIGDRSNFPIVTPDYLFDYFEPLLKKEAYTSEAYKNYAIAASILNKLNEDELCVKIIKTIALIYIVNQFEKLPPIPEMIVNSYKESVSEIGMITAALDYLRNNQYVIYMKKSNHFLKLKTSTGSDIRKTIVNTVEKNRTRYDLKKILEETSVDSYVYPTSYNDDAEITRYFEFRFLDSSEFMEVSNWSKKIENITADGVIYAIIPSSEEEITTLEAKLTDESIIEDRLLFVLPIEYSDIKETAFEYQAVKMLRDEAGDDEALISEYNIYIEDLEEVINAFIFSYYKPELRGANYYYNGSKQSFHRKAQISQFLSQVCYKIFTQTPIINNESINKNFLPRVAINSRNKVVNGLLQNTLSSMLGLTGTGQDVSFMRSTLIKTGLLIDLDANPKLQLHNNENERIQGVINTIRKFFESTYGNSVANFGELYRQLTRPEHHIGLKKGVIPIYIACVLHEYKEHMVISTRSIEVEITTDLLNSINEEPDSFTVCMEDWNEDKARYITALEKLFFDYVVEREKEYNTFSYITKAMQRWFIALPKYSKGIRQIYSGNGRYQEVDKKNIKFINFLKQPILNAREFLFDKVLGIFEQAEFSFEVNELINATKVTFDEAKPKHIDIMAKEMIRLFDPNISNEASYKSVLTDWCESLREQTMSHIFGGNKARIFDLIKTVTNDQTAFIERLAKATTGLRIDDWNDKTVEVFISEIKSFKEAVESYDKNIEIQRGSEINNAYKLTLVDETGIERIKTFDRVEYSNRAILLKNEIISSLEEMGEAISESEKRQVLMEILENMC